MMRGNFKSCLNLNEIASSLILDQGMEEEEAEEEEKDPSLFISPGLMVIRIC